MLITPGNERVKINLVSIACYIASRSITDATLFLDGMQFPLTVSRI